MPFTFKLSKRLAQMHRQVLLASAAALAACMGAETTIVGPNQPGSVSRMQLSPNSVTLLPNQTTNFTAVGFTAVGDTAMGMTVSWSVTAGAITGTSTSGGNHYGSYKSGSQPGKYKVIAQGPGGKADSAVVTVNPVPVAIVAVSPVASGIQVSGTVQLTATPEDSSGAPLSGRSVTWGTSNTGLATVSGTGLVTGLAAGAVTITATSEFKSGTAGVTVTIAPVASVAVSPAAPSVAVGQTVQLTAAPKDASGNALSGRVVTWASSNTAVATVSGSGLVSGVAAGPATITATSEGQSGTATVTVTALAPPPVATVSVSPATASVQVGATVQLTATPKDASGNPLSGRVVTWASSNTAVAPVNGSGLVSGVAAGPATITATSEGKSGTAALTVTATVTNPGTVTDLAVAGVTDTALTLAFTEVSDGTGQPASYDVRVGGGTLSWSAAPSVGRGSCTTPVAGSVIGAKRSCTVLGLTAATGYQVQLVAFRGTLNVNAVFGALSNLASGTTAASTAPVATVTLSPASASLAVGATQPLTATLKDAAGNVLTGRRVTWATSNAAVATVSGSGLVSGLVIGAVTITAMSEGQSGTA